MYDIAFLLVIFSQSIAVGRGRLMLDVPKYSAGKHSCLGVNSFDNHAGFPLGLENLEKWEGIFQSGKSQGILNRLEKSGKSQGKPHKILEN